MWHECNYIHRFMWTLMFYIYIYKHITYKLFEKCKRIYGLKVMKSEFKKAGTLQLTGIRRIAGELLCVRDVGADSADGGYLLWMTFLSSHSTSASVSELSRLVTHTAVSSPKCNSEKRPLSNSIEFQTLFK